MRKYFSLFYKLFIVSLGLVGILLYALNSTRFSGNWHYFGIISNVICFLYLLLLIILELGNVNKNNIFFKFKFYILVFLIMNMLVYYGWFVPNDYIIPGIITNSLCDAVIHAYIPVLVLFDYLIFDKKGQFDIKSTFYVWIIPICYFIYITIYTYFGGLFNTDKFPYYFMNYQQLGLFKVILCMILILILFYIVGLFITLFDKIMAKRVIK